MISGGVDAQVNIGGVHGLSTVHGEISLSDIPVNLSTPPTSRFSISGRFGLKIDDRQGPGAGAAWTIDQGQTLIGDLKIKHGDVNFPNPYLDIFSKYEAFTSSGSSVRILNDPSFYFKKLNGEDFPSPITITYPSVIDYQYEGASVEIGPFAAVDDSGRSVSLSMSGLPPGLSFDSVTGMITGVLGIGSARLGPYQVTLQATGAVRDQTASFILPVTGIRITEVDDQIIKVEHGVSLQIQATSASGGAIAYSADALPAGLSIDPATGLISGVVADQPYGDFYSTISAAQDNDVMSIMIRWTVFPPSGENVITIWPIDPQSDREGDSVNLPIAATDLLGRTLSFDVQGLPPGLAWDSDYSLIAGSIPVGAAGASPYHVVVTVTDGSQSARAEFDWSIIALAAIALSPADLSVAPGTTTQYKATGTYADGSTADWTSLVSWTSSKQTAATIDASGLAKALAGGATTITASVVAISASTGLTVKAPQHPAIVTATSVSWGARGMASVGVAGDGLRLLPAGRTGDIGWKGIDRISITLDKAATLTAADVVVQGLIGVDYGPVSVTGSGTSWLITLAKPIDAADRVAITIGNADVSKFVGRLDVLPGDVNDDGAVTVQDAIFVRNGLFNFGGQSADDLRLDVLGEGVATLNGYNAIRRLIASRLPS